MQRCCQRHIFKAAEDMGANGFVFERASEEGQRVIDPIDVRVSVISGHAFR